MEVGYILYNNYIYTFFFRNKQTHTHTNLIVIQNNNHVE